MAATPYRPLSWAPNEVMTEAKMDQIANNSQWLFENKPNVNYNAHGVRRVIGVKIMCGVTTIPYTLTGIQTVAAYFGNFFSVGCRPIVTTGVVSFQRRMHIITNGFGVMFPDHRGMEIVAECYAPDGGRRIQNTFWVNWMAMGY